MNQHLATYLRRHTVFVTALIILIFLLLATGEYILFRRLNHLNKMLAEGLMQVKEVQAQQTKLIEDLSLDNAVLFQMVKGKK